MTTEDQLRANRDAHLFGPGPKRILSLDGGGVRGAATLAFLERIEAQIEEIEGRPVRLCSPISELMGQARQVLRADDECNRD